MKAEQLRKSILQLAIQGKLVPQDPNDEPASVLLERIRAEKQRLIKEGKIKKDKNDSVIFKGDDNRHYEKVGSEVKDITDDLPFEIPDNWAWTRFSTLIRIIGGVSYDKKDVTQTGIRILRGGNINNLEISLFSDDVFLPEKYYDHEKQVQENDILIVASTGSKSVIGKAGYVLTPMPNTQIGAFLRIVRCIDKIYVAYTKLIFATEYYREHIRQLSQGTNINNVKAEYINNMLIPLPPLSEQARIVAEIKKYEPLIAEYDKLEQQATKLDGEIYDKLKKSILQYAIQGKLVPQDPNDEPASVLLERIRAEKKAKLGKKYVDSCIYKGDDNCYYEHIAGRAQDELVEVPFDIPENWVWLRVNNCCDIRNGFTPSRAESKYWENGTIPWFTVEDINTQGKIIKTTKQYITELATTKERIVPANSFLLCCTASIGMFAKNTIALTTNQQFNALTVKSDYVNILSIDYLFAIGDYFSEHLHRLAGKTTFEFVSVKKLGQILLPLPSLAEQKRIVAKINDIFAML